MKRVLCLLILAALGLAALWTQRPRVYPPGILVPEDPVQSDLPAPRTLADLQVPRMKGEWTCRPLADFSVRARVLRVRDYPVAADDPLAEICPRDLALGWGIMSDQAVLDALRITQAGRFYFFEYPAGPPPAPREQIISHSTNLHPIAADAEIARRLGRVRAGDLIRLRGPLVECSQPGLDRPALRSSLSRTDTRGGACEIMWVEELETLPTP